MPPDAIVITFDIAEDFRARLLDRLENAAFDKFRLKPGKEAFRLGVIATVSLAAHRLPKASIYSNLRYSTAAYCEPRSV